MRTANAAGRGSSLNHQNILLRINMENIVERQSSMKQNKSGSTHQYKDWDITIHSNVKLSNPIMIEGMPGIGNVGKISMDILVEETKAKLVASFFSFNLPNSVFVNEKNLVDLPKIDMYYKRINNKDFLFLTGDVQPTTEASSYAFTEAVLDVLKQYGCNSIATLGGIGLATIPDAPRVYITGNDKLFVEEISKSLAKKNIKIEDKIYGMVGPIIGVSGLLLGVSKKYGIKSYSLLAETFGHPMYVGLKGSKAILNILNVYYKFGLKLDKLDKEILDLDRNGPEKDSQKYMPHSDVNYIG